MHDKLKNQVVSKESKSVFYGIPKKLHFFPIL